MEDKKRGEKGRDKLESKYSGADLFLLAQQYIIDCRKGFAMCDSQGRGEKARVEGGIPEKAGSERKSGKRGEKGESGRFPNIAGFCRYLGISARKYLELTELYPEETGCISAAFEDEALNSEIAPTLIGAYLKIRLGYSEARSDKKTEGDAGELKLVFEHDIMADGE